MAPANTMLHVAGMIGDGLLVEVELEAARAGRRDPGMTGAIRTSLRLNNDLTVGEFVRLCGTPSSWVRPVLVSTRPLPAEGGGDPDGGGRATTSVWACILNPYTIHPAEIAMIAATLEEWSGGRFPLGLGAGAAEFLDWVGLAQTTAGPTRGALGIRDPARERGADPAPTSQAYLASTPPGRPDLPRRVQPARCSA